MQEWPIPWWSPLLHHHLHHQSPIRKSSPLWCSRSGLDCYGIGAVIIASSGEARWPSSHYHCHALCSSILLEEVIPSTYFSSFMTLVTMSSWLSTLPGGVSSLIESVLRRRLASITILTSWARKPLMQETSMGERAEMKQTLPLLIRIFLGRIF